MGDRGNIVVQEAPGKRVYLYSHWGGSELPAVLARALARKQRWTDAPYLARIIFCEMVVGHEKEEIGFGISTGLCDNEHPILVVDVEKQVVRLETEKGKTQPNSVQLGFSVFANWPNVTCLSGCRT